MIKFELNNQNLSDLQSKGKIYTYLSSKFDKAYFKLSDGKFTYALCGGDGLVSTTIDIDYSGDTQYYSVEYSKWVTALQKFSGVGALKFSLNKSLLKISVEGSLDEINLGVINYEPDSMAAMQLDSFIPTKKEEIVGANHKLELTPEIISDFDLMNNLFTTQNRVNSIGVSKEDVMYADRSVVVKANLVDDLPDELFSGISEEDNHIYLHSFTLKMFDYLSEFNTSVYFDSEYEFLYWSDGKTSLVVCSDERNVNLPTQDQFEGIQPADKNVFIDVNVDSLKDALNFFTGFYDGSSWKPLKFSLKKDKETVLYYKHPTAEINKTLNGVVSGYDGEFLIESETLRKILQKIRERFAGDGLSVRFTFDPAGSDTEAPGVYCTVADTYEFIISKLSDE